MKINLVPTVISAALAALISYALYEISSPDENALLLTFIGGFYLLLTLWGSMGYTIEGCSRVVNMKVLSGVFFVIGLVVEIIFAIIGFTLPVFIILHGVMLLIWILITHSLYKAG